MSDERGRPGADDFLRRGLRDYARSVVDAGEAAAGDFNARVLAALARPVPWWRAALEGLRPMLAGAACACVLVVLMASVPWQAGQTAAPQRPVSARTIDLDRALDSPLLTRASLARLSLPAAPARRLPPRGGQRGMLPGRENAHDSFTLS